MPSGNDLPSSGRRSIVSVVAHNARETAVRILAVHDRPEWSMAHHCADLRAALEDDCTIDIRSCGRNWEGLQQLAQSIDASYDRIYVAGELLGQYFFKLLPE